jgi:hypothetical protein
LDKLPEYPSWQTACLAAINEPDPEQLRETIIAAETAMFKRSLQLESQNSEPERLAMEQAAKSLQTLRVIVFGYPGLKK